MSEKKMPFMGHVDELRGRMRITLIIFVLVFFVTYVFSDKILLILWGNFLNQFAQGELVLLADSVMSGFVTQLNISIILASAISMPTLIYEIFMFIEPALRKKQKMIVAKIVLSSIFLFTCGVLFVYFLMLPNLLEFFVESNSNLGISNYFSVEAFFEFVLFNLFIGGLIFQTPLIIIIANRIGILPKAWLTHSRRIMYITILFIAGIITPDHSIISQLLLGGVMILLFEISLIFSK